jgi:hypothetical protein
VNALERAVQLVERWGWPVAVAGACALLCLSTTVLGGTLAQLVAR